MPEHARGKPIEVWFQDEARVGQQGTLTYVWAERGSRPSVPRDNRHHSVWLFGAVCPERGTTAALVLPHVCAQAMTLHLAELSTQVAPGSHALVLMDGAGWHQTGGRLSVPDNVTPLPLPPYSPELNGAEAIWAWLRANRLSHRVWDNHEEIVNDCCAAWNDFASAPQRVASVTRRAWASVNG